MLRAQGYHAPGKRSPQFKWGVTGHELISFFYAISFILSCYLNSIHMHVFAGEGTLEEDLELSRKIPLISGVPGIADEIKKGNVAALTLCTTQNFNLHHALLVFEINHPVEDEINLFSVYFGGDPASITKRRPTIDNSSDTLRKIFRGEKTNSSGIEEYIDPIYFRNVTFIIDGAKALYALQAIENDNNLKYVIKGSSWNPFSSASCYNCCTYVDKCLKDAGINTGFTKSLWPKTVDTLISYCERLPHEKPMPYYKGLSYPEYSNSIRNMFLKGNDFKEQKKYQESVKCFLESAKKGHSGAQYIISLLYYRHYKPNHIYKNINDYYMITETDVENKIIDYHFILEFSDFLSPYPPLMESIIENGQNHSWIKSSARNGFQKARIDLRYFYTKRLGGIERVNLYYDQGVLWEDFKEFNQLYAQAVDQDANAQYNVGLRYYSGTGILQGYALAIAWFTKAANQNHVTAQYKLGQIYENGIGAPQDHALAFRWYIRAAMQHNAAAQYKLGQIYENGIGVPQDYVLAFEWYTRAANQNHVEAQYILGWMYENGISVPQDHALAFRWYTKAANHQNHVDAQCKLGWMYENGIGVPQDHALAFRWYIRAAHQGHLYAQNNLGWMYGNGIGVLQDYTLAFEWYTKAANQNHVGAQNNLGWMYENGTGVLQDYALAIEWFTKAANQNHSGAQCNLGWMYEKGVGVSQDYALAFKWYTKAANQKHVTAQYKLGWMYENGIGVPQDYALAVEWFTKAANQNHSGARRRLVQVYRNGRERLLKENYLRGAGSRNGLGRLGAFKGKRLLN